jgi:hypothetical protein
MTLPLEQSMERERAKPVDGMARIVVNHMFTQPGFDQKFPTAPSTATWDQYAAVEQAAARFAARAVFDYLVSHGFITIEGLLAMKAEQEAGK